MANEYFESKLYKIFFCTNDIKKVLIKYSQSLLYIIGFVFIASGSVQLALSDTAPEKAQDQPPEKTQGPDENAQQLSDDSSSNDPRGDFAAEGATAFSNDFLLTAPAIPLVSFAAEGAINSDPEQTFLPAADPDLLEPNYDDSLPRFATGNLLWFIEGPFGALIMVSAGIGAIIAGAFGGYKAAITLLFVALGAFILRAVVSLFFGTNYQAYSVDFAGEGLR